MSRVPFVDLQAQYRRIQSEVDARIQGVLEHGRFIMGPEVAELETALGDFVSCRHAISVSSGTDALLMVLMAEGIGPGHAVFVPSFTFPATAEVVLLAGARPVFIDVHPRSFHLDLDHLRQEIDIIKSRGECVPRAIIPVDLFGLPADYSAIRALAQEHGLFVLADAAQSFGAQLCGRRVGTLAPATATSFYPAKPLGCYGDGGAIFTDDDVRAEKLRSIRDHGAGHGSFETHRIGINGRLDTLQAAILLPKLAIFAEELAAREQLAKFYDSRLASLVTTPLRLEDRASSWAQYSILLDERDEVAARLGDAGIPTAVYYPVPMHLQTPYSQYGGGPNSLPISERLCPRVLSLPIHPYMEEATADRICSAIERALT